jgi:hypothetical protein
MVLVGRDRQPLGLAQGLRIKQAWLAVSNRQINGVRIGQGQLCGGNRYIPPLACRDGQARRIRFVIGIVVGVAPEQECRRDSDSGTARTDYEINPDIAGIRIVNSHIEQIT